MIYVNQMVVVNSSLKATMTAGKARAREIEVCQVLLIACDNILPHLTSFHTDDDDDFGVLKKALQIDQEITNAPSIAGGKMLSRCQ